jgi:RNA polymerase sigma-70 factor, ECF subfamily
LVVTDNQAIAQPTDAELILRLQSGDAQALGPLYQRYRGVVNAVVQRQAGELGRAEAEDVCHDVFLTLMKIAPRHRAGADARAWLCGIATRKAWRLRRSRWLRDGLLARFMRPKEPAWSPSPPAEQRVEVQSLLDRLPQGLKDVVVLSLVEQLAAEDVAAALSINVKTVWTRLHRARERIRQMMTTEAAR